MTVHDRPWLSKTGYSGQCPLQCHCLLILAQICMSPQNKVVVKKNFLLIKVCPRWIDVLSPWFREVVRILSPSSTSIKDNSVVKGSLTVAAMEVKIGSEHLKSVRESAVEVCFSLFDHSHIITYRGIDNLRRGIQLILWLNSHCELRRSYDRSLITCTLS